MNKFASIAIGLPLGLVLAACGGNDEAAEGAGETASAEAVMAQPGEYRTTATLAELTIPGASNEQLEQFRGIVSEGLADGKTFCLAAQDAEAAGRELAKQLAEGDCSVEEFALNGGNMDASMMCSIPLPDGQSANGPVSVEGTVREQSSSMTVAMDQVMPTNDGSEMTANMTIRMDSQRIGECTADAG